MYGIPHVHCYYFYLEPASRKDTWMRTTSVTVMVIFFLKVAYRKYLITTRFKAPSQELSGTLKTAF